MPDKKKAGHAGMVSIGRNKLLNDLFNILQGLKIGKNKGYLSRMKKRYTHLFLFLFAVLASLPLFQQVFHPFKLAGLQGVYDAGTKPEFTFDSWFKGTYQKQSDFYLKNNTAFNGELVRLRNQVDYSGFGNINTILTLGKDNYIFDPNYIYAREGSDLLSDSIRQYYAQLIADDMVFLDSLKVPVLFCIAPNKANFYSGYLPEKSIASRNTNQHYFKNMLLANGISVIDFDSLFEIQKATSPYLLVPKYGAHWSTYGASVAADSLLRVVKKITKKETAFFTVSGMEVLSKPKFSDDDYLGSLNMMIKWKSPAMAYPKLVFKEGYKPNALIISDSFMWNFFDLGVIPYCFSEKSGVRYYNKTGYDVHKKKLGALSPNLALDELQERDIIILIATGPSMKDFGFRFFEQVNELRK